MVAPVFGWSAGDIVQSIRIINELCDAFKENGRASTKFADSTAFLESFKSILSHIKNYANDSSTAKYTEAINEQVKLIDPSYNQFEKHMLKFYPALGVTSTKSGLQKAPKRIKWALKELSDVSGKVAELKKAVADPVVLIGPLLQLQSLDTIGTIATQVSKLPDASQFDTLKSALKNTVVAAMTEFQEHIHDLKQAADHQGEQLAVQSESLMSLTKYLSQKEVGARSTVSDENEKSQQQRIVECTKMMTNIEGISVALQEKLDTIIASLADRGDLLSWQLKPLEDLEARIITQQVISNQIQGLAEASVAKVADMIAIMEITGKEAKDHKRLQRTNKWLSQFANQLIASGITSAMTGAVVLIASRSKSTCSEKSDDRVEKTYSTPKKVKDPALTSRSFYQPSQTSPGNKQNGGRAQGSNVNKAGRWIGLWARLESQPSLAAQSNNRITHANSNKKSLMSPQSTSSRFIARTSINVSTQSPANPFVVPGFKQDLCIAESPFMQSQMTTASIQPSPYTSSSISSTLPNSAPSTAQAPTKSAMPYISSSRNTSNSLDQYQVDLDQYQMDLEATADYRSSTSNHSDDVSRTSPNNKNIFSASTQSLTSTCSAVTGPTPPAPVTFRCCQCHNFWPIVLDACQLCGHFRDENCLLGHQNDGSYFSTF